MHRLTLALVVFAAACTTDDGEGPVWDLVWQDTFDGDEGESPDDSIWTYDLGAGGWGNNELQNYTLRPENVSRTGDGRLRIRAIRENFEGSPWTSARIVTRGLREPRYGRIEARIRTPVERGVWPAFWMLGADIDENPWPLAGEIDIMEVFGVRAVGSAIHGPGYSGGQNVGFPYLSGESSVAGFDEAFHTFQILWDPEQIVWIIDDEVTGVATPADLPTGAAWVFDHEFYLLINLAIGGNPVQEPDDTTPDVNDLLIDYVKVFERREPLLDPNAPTDP